ncbi:hypothetical protein GE278_21690 (plasmid) [Enterobacteriaceae bacterium Kacie_13]|nr:hypothetical protein GE278_21690 [Enterobacteriaceae bacterium Kacie_13]
MSQMGQPGEYQNYKKLVFVACREEKRPGTLAPVKRTGLSDGYEIRFSDSSLDDQVIDNPRVKRNTDDTDVDDVIPFDGYLVYEIKTLTLEEGKVSVSSEMIEIAPYINKNT